MKFHLFSRFPHLSAVLAIAVLLLTGTGPGVSSALAAKTPETAAEYYDHAVELIAKGDLEGAVIELKNALQRDPKDLSARVLLGRTYIDLDNGRAAEIELMRARKGGARDSFVLAPLGRALVMQWRYREALKLLGTAGQDQKTAAEILVIRGDAHLAVWEFDAAEKSYLDASKIRPDNAEALIGLARVKMAKNDLAGAKMYARWSIKNRPDDPHAWYIQGEIARMQGKEKEALKSYDRAVELAPRFGKPRVARAAILIDQSRHKEAEPDILVTREAVPNDPHAAYLHALILGRNGKVKEAEEALLHAQTILKGYPEGLIHYHTPTLLLFGVVSYYRKDIDSAHRYLTIYVKRVPQHIPARKLLASIALIRGEAKTAVALLEDLAPRMEQNADFLVMYGEALMRVKRHREASRILEKASALAKPGSSALSKLVRVRLAARQDAEAIKILKSEIDRDPDAVKAALLLGTTYLRRGDFKAALDTANSVLERHPKNAVAHNIAGSAHLNLKDFEAARKSFTAAFEGMPDYVSAIENLANLEASLKNFDRATQLYKVVLEKDPRKGSAMMALARIARRQDDPAGAIRWLEKAVAEAHKPQAAALRLMDHYIEANRAADAVLVGRRLNHEDARNLTFLAALGRAHLAAGQMEQAVLNFKELAERAHEEKLAGWLHRAAVWQLRARDKKGAEESLNKVLELDPRHLPTHFELFRLDMAAGDHERAMERAQKITLLDHRLPAGYVLKGDVHMQLRDYAAAIQAYDTALEKKGGVSVAIKAYGARRAAGKGGLEFVADWVGKRPDEPRVQWFLAMAYADAGRDDDAIVIYERLLKAAPETMQLQNNLAILYQRKGDGRALDYARRVFKASPNDPAFMDTYGWILVRSGKTDEGLGLLRNAVLRRPGDAEIRYHLAAALNASGQTDEARRELEAALRLSGTFEGVDDARALLTKLSGGKL